MIFLAVNDHVILTFTPYERGYKIKDEEAFSAIVAHLNKLVGVDLEPDFISRSASAHAR